MLRRSAEGRKSHPYSSRVENKAELHFMIWLIAECWFSAAGRKSSKTQNATESPLRSSFSSKAAAKSFRIIPPLL
jgi:hypothetical protein